MYKFFVKHRALQKVKNYCQDNDKKNKKEKEFEKHYRIKETEELLVERHMKADNALRVGTERY